MANNHHILEIPIIGILILSSFYFIPPASGKVQPDAVTTTTNEVLQPMTKNQIYNTFGSCFQNQCTEPIRYVFKPNGFAYWSNPTFGNITLTGFRVGGQSRSVTPSSNTTTIDYRIVVPNIITADIFFKETPTNGRPSNTFKITMIGTSSVAGTFSWDFGNPNNFPVTCDNTKKVLTYGRTGINFTDATNFSATCTPTSLSFTIGVGAFKIDPATIGTSSTAGGTQWDSNQACYGIVQTRFWCIYNDGTNHVWRTSLDGATWTAATTMRSGANLGFNTWFDYTANRLFYVYTASAISTVWRSGVFNTDGTITFDFAEQTMTTSSVITSRPLGITVNNTPDLFVLLHKSNGNFAYVYKCAGATSTCTPTLILNASAVGNVRQMLSFTDGRIMEIHSTGNGVVVQQVRTCASTCATTTDWTALKSVTTCDDSGGNARIHALSITTIAYFACTRSSTSIYFATCSSTCGTLVTETAIYTGGTVINGVSISSDNSNYLYVGFTDSSQNIIGHLNSLNLGITWNSVYKDILSQTNIVTASLVISEKIVTTTVILEAWTAGTANPFNVRTQVIAVNTPTIIQSTSCTYTGSSGTCALASNTKAMSTILVLIGSAATIAVSSVQDTQLLTYSLIISSDVGTVGDDEAWLACHPTTAAADTIRVNSTISITATIVLYELHGRPTGTSCAPSSSSGSSASSSTASVTSYTPTRNAFIIAALNSNCQVACTITAGSGYSLDKNVAINAVNMYTTEYFWNVQTADTSPYTFSVASAYNEISVALYDLIWTNNTQSDSTTLTESILRTPTPKLADSATIAENIFKGELRMISDSFTIAENILRIAIPLIQDTFNIVITIPLVPSAPIVVPLPSIPQEDNSIIWILLLVLMSTIFVGALIRNIALRNRFHQ